MSNDRAAKITRTWTQVNDIVGLGDNPHAMLDDHDGIARLDKSLQLQQQAIGIGWMQACSMSRRP
jgi:hypothetical protein